MKKDPDDKYKNLLDTIKPYGHAVIAFSGGVDSTFLVYAAAEALGRENILCVTARASSFPERELEEAKKFCGSYGIRQEVLEFDELSVPGFSANPPNRCYLCKKELFSQIIAYARGQVVFEGSNKDDENDFRPGMKAVAELEVKSPLIGSGFGKDDIRLLSKEFGLPTWNKQSFACLASRFVYGEEITREKLEIIGKAEQYLLDKGFSTVRVRLHGEENFMARIETGPEELTRLVRDPLRTDTEIYFKSIGFTYVTLDLSGYRSGSMNESLDFTLQTQG